MNELSSTIIGRKILPNFQPLAEYTGELFGVEYLYAQSGMTFVPSEEDLLTEIDEGFGDTDEELPSPEFEVSTDDITVALPSDDSESEEEVS